MRNAYQSQHDTLKSQLIRAGIKGDDYEMLIRVFKQDQEMEVWLRQKGENQYRFFKTYSICASSGDPGPKRKEGDGQVPEGFYQIESFNPFSNYHLSLKVNYPNKSDKLKSKGNTGGDIMIHGECVTIGCVPIQNRPIEELYVLGVESKDKGHTIRVHMFPFRFKAVSDYQKMNISQDLKDFWKTLSDGFFYFEKNRILPKIEIDQRGNYVLKP